MKKTSSFILTVLLAMLLFALPVVASTPAGDASVMSLGTTKCSLEINAFTAKPSATATAGGSDSISMTVYLQKYKDGSWTSVKSKSSSTTSDSLTVSFTKLITAGSFRTKAVSTIVDGSETETLTSYSSVVVKE